MALAVKDYLNVVVDGDIIIITFIGPCEDKLTPLKIRESEFMGCFDPNPYYQGNPFDRVSLKGCIASMSNGTIIIDYNSDGIIVEVKCYITDTKTIYTMKLYFLTNPLVTYDDMHKKYTRKLEKLQKKMETYEKHIDALSHMKYAVKDEMPNITGT